MITLTLLHPAQSKPVQVWTFEQESVIRIGRATDNHVVLYSAVVSRYHVELRRGSMDTWEVVSLGGNGTYVDGELITQLPVHNGTTIRLARSGPNLQIRFDGNTPPSLSADRRPAPDATPRGTEGDHSAVKTDIFTVEERLSKALDPDQNGATAAVVIPKTRMELAPTLKVEGLFESGYPAELPLDEPRSPQSDELAVHGMPCTHQRAQVGMMFCPDCGQPLQVLETLGEYRILKTLGSDGFALTQLAWRQGRSLLMQSLDVPWRESPEAIAAFTQRVQQLAAQHHPHLPRSVEVLHHEGQTYWVVESIWGHSLRQEVAVQGPFALNPAISLLSQVASLLQYLHQQSPPVIHQGLQPEHVLYHAANARGKLPDSPTARVPVVTVTGLFAGLGLAQEHHRVTHHAYAAPEQWLGQSVGIATDLFALGLLGGYLLTGQEPLDLYSMGAVDPEVPLVAIAFPDLPPLPPAVLEILQRLTLPRPTDRYATAQAVVEALAAVA